MTSVRLIPCLDIKDGRVVKGVNFVGMRDAGDPVELAKYYDASSADELVFLDISASASGSPSVIDLARRVADEVFIPFTVGGGLREIKDIREALRAGADKVSLNTAAVQNPDFISRAADSFGSQCILVAIDAKRFENDWIVTTHGGRTPTSLSAVAWAEEVVRRGAGEILLTSMDSDGTRSGYDLELTAAIADVVPVPVIASGGAGNALHLVDAVQIGHADAVLLAGILHDRVTTIASLKEEMRRAGLEIRQVTPAAGP